MNAVHQRILKHVRELAANEPEINLYVSATPDAELARLMFMNLRGVGASAKGIRLTNLGLTIMKTFFHSFEVPAHHEGRQPTANELLYLDKKASLPYHIDSQGEMTLFDTKLGLKLKLVDGDISALIEAEGR